LGIAMCGTALGGVIWPVATQGLLDRFGWRMAYALLGGAVLLIAVPLLVVFLKDSVEAHPASPQNAAAKTAANPGGLSRREALGSDVLWLLLVAYFVVSASIQACMIHLKPMLTDRGMTDANAVFALALLGGANMVSRLGTGYLLDLLPAARIPVMAFGCVAAGIFLLFTGATGGSSYLAAMLIGLGYGAESATIPYLVSRYFGMRSFGEIYSYLFITVPLGGALGPLLMGVGFDRTGSYRLVLLGCGLATVIAAILMLRLKAYPTYNTRS
jgi:MFS family permease